MNKIGYLRKFPQLHEKGELYSLFQGFVYALRSDEICSLAKYIFLQDKVKRKIISWRLMELLKKEPRKKCFPDLFDNWLLKIDQVNTYHQKEACAKILLDMSRFLSDINRSVLIRLFLSSEYKNNHKRAYNLLREKWDGKFLLSLDNILKVSGEVECALLLIQFAPENYLRRKFSFLSEILEEYAEYNFSMKITRNKFYARFIDQMLDQLEKYKKDDPITYIFIMKEAGKDIDSQLLEEIYDKNEVSRRYLARWFGEMGAWDTLAAIREKLNQDK